MCNWEVIEVLFFLFFFFKYLWVKCVSCISLCSVYRGELSEPSHYTINIHNQWCSHLVRVRLHRGAQLVMCKWSTGNFSSCFKMFPDNLSKSFNHLNHAAFCHQSVVLYVDVNGRQFPVTRGQDVGKYQVSIPDPFLKIHFLCIDFSRFLVWI